MDAFLGHRFSLKHGMVVLCFTHISIDMDFVSSRLNLRVTDKDRADTEMDQLM